MQESCADEEISESCVWNAAYATETAHATTSAGVVNAGGSPITTAIALAIRHEMSATAAASVPSSTCICETAP